MVLIAPITFSSDKLYFLRIFGLIFIIIALSYPPKTSTFPIFGFASNFGSMKEVAIFLISGKVILLFFGLSANTSTGSVKSPTK